MRKRRYLSDDKLAEVNLRYDQGRDDEAEQIREDERAAYQKQRAADKITKDKVKDAKDWSDDRNKEYKKWKKDSIKEFENSENYSSDKIKYNDSIVKQYDYVESIDKINARTRESLDRKFAEQSIGEQRSPKDANSRYNYDTYKQDYYSGSQAKVFMGDIWVDDIITIQYSINQSKQPIFGYASQNFDAVAAGTVMGEGTMAVAFKEVGYMNVIRSYIEEQRKGASIVNNQIASRLAAGDTDEYRSSAYSARLQGTMNPGLIRKSETIEEILDTLANTNKKDARGKYTNTPKFQNPNYQGRDFEDLAEVLEDSIWGDFNGKVFGGMENALKRIDQFDEITNGQGDMLGIKSANNAHTFTNYEAVTNILITFGDTSDTRSEHTMTVLNDIHFTGTSVMVNPTGEPIAEVYNFFFRDINKTVTNRNSKVNKIAFNLNNNEQFYTANLDAVNKILDENGITSIDIEVKSGYDKGVWSSNDYVKLLRLENIPVQLTNNISNRLDVLNYAVEKALSDMFIEINVIFSFSKLALVVTTKDDKNYKINMIAERQGEFGNDYVITSPNKDRTLILDLVKREDFFKVVNNRYDVGTAVSNDTIGDVFDDNKLASVTNAVNTVSGKDTVAPIKSVSTPDKSEGAASKTNTTKSKQEEKEIDEIIATENSKNKAQTTDATDANVKEDVDNIDDLKELFEPTIDITITPEEANRQNYLAGKEANTASKMVTMAQAAFDLNQTDENKARLDEYTELYRIATIKLTNAEKQFNAVKKANPNWSRPEDEWVPADAVDPSDEEDEFVLEFDHGVSKLNQTTDETTTPDEPTKYFSYVPTGSNILIKKNISQQVITQDPILKSLLGLTRSDECAKTQNHILQKCYVGPTPFDYSLSDNHAWHKYEEMVIKHNGEVIFENETEHPADNDSRRDRRKVYREVQQLVDDDVIREGDVAILDVKGTTYGDKWTIAGFKQDGNEHVITYVGDGLWASSYGGTDEVQMLTLKELRKQGKYSISSVVRSEQYAAATTQQQIDITAKFKSLFNTETKMVSKGEHIKVETATDNILNTVEQVKTDEDIVFDINKPLDFNLEYKSLTTDYSLNPYTPFTFGGTEVKLGGVSTPDGFRTDGFKASYNDNVFKTELNRIINLDIANGVIGNNTAVAYFDVMSGVDDPLYTFTDEMGEYIESAINAAGKSLQIKEYNDLLIKEKDGTVPLGTAAAFGSNSQDIDVPTIRLQNDLADAIAIAKSQGKSQGELFDITLAFNKQITESKKLFELAADNKISYSIESDAKLANDPSHIKFGFDVSGIVEEHSRAILKYEDYGLSSLFTNEPVLQSSDDCSTGSTAGTSSSNSSSSSNGTRGSIKSVTPGAYDEPINMNEQDVTTFLIQLENAQDDEEQSDDVVAGTRKTSNSGGSKSGGAFSSFLGQCAVAFTAVKNSAFGSEKSNSKKQDVSLFDKAKTQFVVAWDAFSEWSAGKSALTAKLDEAKLLNEMTPAQRAAHDKAIAEEKTKLNEEKAAAKLIDANGVPYASEKERIQAEILARQQLELANDLQTIKGNNKSENSVIVSSTLDILKNIPFNWYNGIRDGFYTTDVKLGKFNASELNPAQAAALAKTGNIYGIVPVQSPFTPEQLAKSDPLSNTISDIPVIGSLFDGLVGAKNIIMMASPPLRGLSAIITNPKHYLERPARIPQDIKKEITSSIQMMSYVPILFGYKGGTSAFMAEMAGKIEGAYRAEAGVRDPRKGHRDNTDIRGTGAENLTDFGLTRYEENAIQGFYKVGYNITSMILPDASNMLKQYMNGHDALTYGTYDGDSTETENGRIIVNSKVYQDYEFDQQITSLIEGIIIDDIKAGTVKELYSTEDIYNSDSGHKFYQYLLYKPGNLSGGMAHNNQSGGYIQTGKFNANLYVANSTYKRFAKVVKAEDDVFTVEHFVSDDYDFNRYGMGESNTIFTDFAVAKVKHSVSTYAGDKAQHGGDFKYYALWQNEIRINDETKGFIDYRKRILPHIR